jgi:hypothetical protein
MKIKHLLGLALLAVGGLYVYHIYSQHGGVGGFKSGLGV